MTFALSLNSRGVVALMAGLLAVLFGPLGCSDEGATASSGGGDAACPSGEVKSPDGTCACPAAMVPGAAGGCHPAGLPLDMPCAPGEMQLPSGVCEPAGVAPEACAEGFEPDGKRGCNAILPEDDCPKGLMAIPGETKCREVAPCGSGTWGDIPEEADTEYVDGSYSGGSSNGTKEKPWTTIQAAINMAKEGAIVAVAAGSYKESVLIEYRSVRLWGRCPSMVEIVGGTDHTVLVGEASGTEVRGLALRGPTFGLVTFAATDVIADQIWVHHTGKTGVYLDNSFGPASLTVSSSLIEAITGTPMASFGASLTLTRSVVRDTASASTSLGITIEDYTGKRGSAKILSSVISRTHRYGVALTNSNVQIEATLIRDIKLRADGTFGAGVFAKLDGKSGTSGDLTIRSSVIEDARTSGVAVVGPGLAIEATVIRRILPDKSGELGRGLSVEPNNELRGDATIRGSLVEDSYELGIDINGSDALIEGTIVRDTKRGMTSSIGLGVGFRSLESLGLGGRANGTIRSSVIERSATVGIRVSASDATIETSIIADTNPNEEDFDGVGIGIPWDPVTFEPSSVLVRSCLIERNVLAGVAVVGSDATIETSHVRDTRPGAQGFFGDGVVMVSTTSPATALLYGTRIESSGRAGIASFGGHVVLDRMALTCGVLDIDGEALNGVDFVFDDRGSAACGCPAATDRCHVQSAGLQPPPALEGF